MTDSAPSSPPGASTPSSSSSYILPMRPDHLNETSGVGASLGAPPSVSEDDLSKSMKISLQLEAQHLPNMDSRGKSDPFVVLYRKIDTSPAREEWVKIGQTETVYNNLFPKWSTLFSMEYRFGANSILRFRIYDRDSRDDDLSKQDYIGEVRCTVAQIVLADNQRLVLQIHRHNARPGAKLGALIIRGEEEKGDLGDSVTFQFAVNGLRHGRKPFYVLSRRNKNDNDYSPVIYSEVHQSYSSASNQYTTFKPITKSLATMVNGDMDRGLKIQFLEYDRRGNHYRGGNTTFTLSSMRADMAASAGDGKCYVLRKRKSNGLILDAGVLLVKKLEISMPYSFLDYIRSGVVINLVVAVDMSATNGNPANPSSLQYNSRQAPNEYVIALREVGNVLAAYDTSKTFPAFGFGAALPPSYNETAHCFALTGNITQPICNGVEGVIDMYYNALHNVAPYAPCLYGPVLDHVIRLTKDEDGREDRTVYTIMLLVTDGDFNDFANVANLICSAADLPLSIVIVGVGNSRFIQLERLDGDETPLCSSDGTPCARDIVQFVQFHRHRYNPAQLAKEVLDEIPGQLVSYMRSKSIKPSDIQRHVAGTVKPPNQGLPSGPYIPGPVPPLAASSPIVQPRIPVTAVQSEVQSRMPGAVYPYSAQPPEVPGPLSHPGSARPRYPVMNQFSPYQNPGPPNPNIPYSMSQHPGHTPQHPGHTPQHPGHTPQHPGHTSQHPGHTSQHTGHTSQYPHSQASMMHQTSVSQQLFPSHQPQ